jgi:hypothetical protein
LSRTPTLHTLPKVTMTTMATTAACSATHASQSTPHEEDIDTLALCMKNLRIALSKAESHLALKKQEVMANKDEPPTKARAEGRANAGFVLVSLQQFVPLLRCFPSIFLIPRMNQRVCHHPGCTYQHQK